MARRIRRSRKAGSPARPAPGEDGHGGGHLTWVLLVLAAVVVGLTLYVALAPPGGGDGKPDQPPAPPLYAEVLDNARGLMATGLFASARDLMAGYVRRNADDVHVRPLLAEAQLNLGKLDEAEKTIDALLSLAPDSAAGLWLKGQVAGLRGRDGYMDYFRRAAESPQATAEIWSRYGRALLSARRREDGAAYLRRAVEAGAKDPPTLFALGEVSFAMDQYEQAEGYLRQGLRGDRRDARAWHTLASVQSASGRHADAEQSLQEALQVCPAADRPGLLMELAAARWRQPGRKEAAAETYVEAARHPAVRAEAAYRAARCYYVLDRPALAMQYIDIAAAMPGAGEAVADLLAKIEDARFGKPEPASRPAGLPAFGAGSWEPQPPTPAPPVSP